MNLNIIKLYFLLLGEMLVRNTFVCTLIGTLLWFFYPAIHSLFPLWAEQGIIASHLDWDKSVMIAWVIQIVSGKFTSPLKIIAPNESSKQ